MNGKCQQERRMWIYFDAEIQIENRLMGGVPKAPDTIKSWIKTKTGLDGDSLENAVIRTKQEMGIDVMTEEEIEKLSEASWRGFKGGNGEGLYIEARQVKAAIKEAANICKDLLGIKAFKAKIAERVFVHPEKIGLGVDKPTGWIEGPVHAMTARGPITSLKRVDYVERPVLAFRLKVFNEGIKAASGEKLAPEDFLPVLLEYASENGLGADRSQEQGKFGVLKFERIEG